MWPGKSTEMPSGCVEQDQKSQGSGGTELARHAKNNKKNTIGTFLRKEGQGECTSSDKREGRTGNNRHEEG